MNNFTLLRGVVIALRNTFYKNVKFTIKALLLGSTGACTTQKSNMLAHMHSMSLYSPLPLECPGLIEYKDKTGGPVRIGTICVSPSINLPAYNTWYHIIAAHEVAHIDRRGVTVPHGADHDATISTMLNQPITTIGTWSVPSHQTPFTIPIYQVYRYYTSIL